MNPQDPTIWLGLILTSGIGSTLHADEVIYQDSRGKEQRRVGTVLDFSSAGLTISSRGRDVTLAVAGVKRITSEWNAAHQQADDQFLARDYAAALTSYTTAFNDESRGWVKRKLLARVVACQQNIGKTVEACTNFARLTDDDARTPYFSVIPLAWTMRPPERDVAELARTWIAEDGNAAKQLVAASWMLPTPDQGTAIAALRRLSRDSRPEINGLAVAQFWRTQLVTARDSDAERWELHIAKLPSELRAGPYFLLGQLRMRLGRHEEAALAWLRIPTLHGGQAALSQMALLESAKAMREQGETEDARLLYRQAIEWEKDSLAGRSAQAGLDALSP